MHSSSVVFQPMEQGYAARNPLPIYHCGRTSRGNNASGYERLSAYAIILGATMMRLADVKTNLATRGISVSKHDREYRVSFRDAPSKDAEASAYYTDDLEDAYHTGIKMAMRG
jgi:hypothetical protein